MPSGAGHFDSLGNPCLKFHLCGVAHELPGLEYEGIIDTGFTGFLQLPLQHAFSLKLPLEGTASYTLADGTQSACLTALASTTFAGKTVVGVVTLAAGSQDILIGMGFLRQFKLGMMMFKNMIVLIDEDDVEEFGRQQTAKDAASQESAQSPEDSEPPSG
jgi:clan AA aspartic protease